VDNSSIDPNDTINGSGLSDDGLHSTDTSAMWLSSPSEPNQAWIQYHFDQPYILHQMLVWNHNDNGLDSSLGIKKATIEHSLDGINWTPLPTVPEFSQAPGTDGYASDTVVDFNGVAVKQVKIIANSNWGGDMLPFNQYGLSEVRFLYIPMRAREPSPATGSTDVDPAVELTWRAGRAASVHEVYLGSHPNDLSLRDTVTGSPYGTYDTSPLDLQLGQTYYWRIDEVNEAEAIGMWEGGIWSFTTQEYALIDGFEEYDDEDNAIFDTWIDGFVNETGSTVGYFQAPFAERSTVNSGRQSMPLEYNNTGAPFYSEAEFDLGGADLTTGGAVSLRLFFHGNAANVAETLYVAIADSAGNVGLAAHPDPDAVLADSWQEWVIPYSELTAGGVNLSRAAMIYIGLGDRNNPTVGGTGLIFIDDVGFGKRAQQ
jgi:hypothetical protein